MKEGRKESGKEQVLMKSLTAGMIVSYIQFGKSR